MPTPTRHDAITFGVFVGVGLASALAAAVVLEIIASMFDVNASAIVDTVLAVAVAVVGGGAAASRYRRRRPND
jgi:hypothetical protein